jgi:hypothetical protein
MTDLSKKQPHYKLSIETEYEKVTTEFYNVDLSLDQLFTAFKAKLIFISYSEETINNHIRELADELTINES